MRTKALSPLHLTQRHSQTQREPAQHPCSPSIPAAAISGTWDAGTSSSAHKPPPLLLTPALASKRKRFGSKAGGAESCAPAFPQRQNTSQPRPCQDKQVRAPERASLHIAEPPANTLPTCQPCSSSRRNVFGKSPHFFRVALPQTRRLAQPAASPVQRSLTGLGEAFASSCLHPWARKSQRDVPCESRDAGGGAGPGRAPQHSPPPPSILATPP